MKKTGKVLASILLLFAGSAFSSEIKRPSCNMIEQYMSQPDSKFNIMGPPNPISGVWMEVFNKELVSWTTEDIKNFKAILLLCMSERSKFIQFVNKPYFSLRLDEFINKVPDIIQSSKKRIVRNKLLQERKKIEAVKVETRRNARETADVLLQKYATALAYVEKQYKNNSLSDDDMAMLKQAQLGLEVLSRNDVTWYGKLDNGRRKAAKLIKTIEARPVYKGEMTQNHIVAISGLAIGIECARHDVAFNSREIEKLEEFLKNELDPLELADGVLDKMWEAMMISIAATRLTEADCLYQHQVLSEFLPKGILDKSISVPFK